jgi:hypothetical protein
LFERLCDCLDFVPHLIRGAVPSSGDGGVFRAVQRGRCDASGRPASIYMLLFIEYFTAMAPSTPSILLPFLSSFPSPSLQPLLVHSFFLTEFNRQECRL